MQTNSMMERQRFADENDPLGLSGFSLSVHPFCPLFSHPLYLAAPPSHPFKIIFFFLLWFLLSPCCPLITHCNTPPPPSSFTLSMFLYLSDYLYISLLLSLSPFLFSVSPCCPLLTHCIHLPLPHPGGVRPVFSQTPFPPPAPLPIFTNERNLRGWGGGCSAITISSCCSPPPSFVILG